VYAVGSPLGLDHTFTSGVISALRSDSIQTDATVHSGSSGGPLLDAGGAICGVITTTHLHKDVSFALYGDTVLAMFEERWRVKTGGSSGEQTGPSL
jgi:S1-C subfamily serine protease